jgi:hypothetical protein
MAAALAHVIIEQGDAAGLITMSGDRFVYLPPKGGRTHLHAMLTMLARLEPAGAWQLDRVLARGGELFKAARRDGGGFGFLTTQTETTVPRTAADRASRPRCGPVAGALAREISFPYSGAMEFEHLETAERRFLDGRRSRGWLSARGVGVSHGLPRAGAPRWTRLCPAADRRRARARAALVSDPARESVGAGRGRQIWPPMILQNPWAWFGLLAIALPIAAHLLSRRPAHRQTVPASALSSGRDAETHPPRSGDGCRLACAALRHRRGRDDGADAAAAAD